MFNKKYKKLNIKINKNFNKKKYKNKVIKKNHEKKN